MRLHQITEALTPSQYRKIVKNWDKSRHEKIFKSGKWPADRNHYRLLIPYTVDVSLLPAVPVPWQIEDALEERGYEVHDYVKGLAKEKNGKRIMRIGKLLQDQILQRFVNDPNRKQVAEDYLIIISRHPYDIAGMSTDRGWTSCMNLNRENARYLPIDVKEGTLVAYITTKDDIDVKSPKGRIAIKPYIEPFTKNIFLMPERACYGNNVPGFLGEIQKWCQEANQLVATDQDTFAAKSPEVYNDTGYGDEMDTLVVSPDAATHEHLKKIHQKPSLIADIANPSVKEQYAAVLGNVMALRHIKEPDPIVVAYAAKRRAESITWVKNPSEDMMLMAIKSSEGRVFNWINLDDVTPAMLELGLEYRDAVFSLLEHPNITREQIQKGIKTKPTAINFFRKPTPEMQLIAVQQSPGAIQYIAHPTDEVVDIAVKALGTDWPGFINHLSAKKAIEIINSYPDAQDVRALMHYLPHRVEPFSEVIKPILDLYPTALNWLDKQFYDHITPEIARYAFNLHPRNIRYLSMVGDITNDELKKALELDPYLITDFRQDAVPDEIAIDVYQRADDLELKRDALKRITNVPDRIAKDAIDRGISLSAFVNPKTKWLVYAVRRRPAQILYLDPEKTPALVQVAAATKDRGTIEALDHVTPRVLLYMIMHDPRYIRYRTSAPDVVSLAAIKADPSVIIGMDYHKPSDVIGYAAIKYSKGQLPDNRNQLNLYTPNALQVGLYLYPKQIALHQDAPDRFKLMAIRRDPSVIELIEKPTEQMVKLAAKLKGKTNRETD